MNERIKTLLVWLVAFLIAGGAIWYGARDKGEATIKVDDFDTEGSGDYTVEILPSEEGPKPPVLGTAIVFSTDLPADARAVISANVEGFMSAVEKNPSDVVSWSELAIHYKMAGDYQKARLAWEYVLVLAPSDVVTLHNLGHLYRYYLKDTAKARFYFEKALALAEQGNNPQLINALKTELSTLK